MSKYGHGLFDLLYDILKLLWGDPSSRTPKLIIMAGISGILDPPWLPIVYEIANTRLGLNAELPLFDYLIFFSGWTLVILGVAILRRSQTSTAASEPRLLTDLMNVYSCTAEADPYADLGVAISQFSGLFNNNNRSEAPYIPRNIDLEIDEALACGRMLLLIGKSKWGKTRTAYEALKRNFPNHKLLVPKSNDQNGLRIALESFVEVGKDIGPTVLWLDDVERFLLTGQVELSLLNNAFKREPELFVIATIRSVEYQRILELSEEIGKQASEFLKAPGESGTFRLGNSQHNELLRGQELYPELAFNFGIGESFVAAYMLRDRLDDSKGACPEAYAVFKAMADWKIAGIQTPIPKSDLRSIYLAIARELGAEATESEMEKGINWMTKSIDGFRLISCVETNDSINFDVQDFLLEHVAKQSAIVCDATWKHVVNHECLNNSMLSVGLNAYRSGRKDIAKMAWKKVFNSNGVSALNLGVLLAEEGLNEDAIHAYRKGIELGVGRAAQYLGIFFEKEERQEEAKQSFQKGIELGFGPAANSLGILLSKSEKNDEAKEAFQKGIDLGDGRSAFNLALRLVKEGNNDEAKLSCERGIGLGAGEAAHLLGNLLVEEGKKEEAKQVFLRGIELGDGECASNLGVLLSNERKLDEALLTFEKGTELGSFNSALNLGAALAKEGKNPEAKQAYQTAIEKGNVLAAERLGSLLIQEGKSEEAKQVFRQGIKLGSGIAATGLGIIFVEEGNNQEAKWSFQQGVQFGDGNAACSLGKLLVQEGKLEEAKQAYQKGVELGHGNAASGLGKLLANEGKNDEAKRLYQIGIELRAGIAASGLGSLLSKEGKNEEAKQAFRKGMELGDGIAASGLGSLLAKEGKMEEAKQAFHKGIELGDGIAASGLGIILAIEGRKEEAKQAYVKGIELGNGIAASGLGILLSEEERSDEAMQAYEKGIELGSGIAARCLGILLAKSGKTEEAKRAYEKAIELSDDVAASYLSNLIAKEQKSDDVKIPCNKDDDHTSN